jgi:glycosyltransferase involved in cell wall biosynthesis
VTGSTASGSDSETAPKKFLETMPDQKFSIVLPAKNEAANLRRLLPELRGLFPGTEIIVVDDGSSDDTEAICGAAGVSVVRHPYSMGNGAAIKTGARAASCEIIVFMDADGQHGPQDVAPLVEQLDHGYDMAVGARSRRSQRNVGRWFANSAYNWLASWIVGHRIPDLTSGFRAVRAGPFREFLHLLPNGFSYPTTITMAFFRAGYSVAYLPIQTAKRNGSSHVNPLKDGVRFFLVIFRVGTLYSPLKVFVPISAVFFLTGIGYYLYTYATQSRFTNMSALLITTSVIIGLIGLVSEQITNMLYATRPRDTAVKR